MKDLKYLAAYLVPAFTVISIYYGGLLSYSTMVFTFVFVPLVELFVPQSEANLSGTEVERKISSQFFDWILYLNLPITFALILFLLLRVQQGGLETYELTGMILSTGVCMGACGINVAHELGHRQNKPDQFLSKLLLMPSLYMHFFIEHNRGHHKNVSTDEDSASAKYGQNIYAFWIQAVFGSYFSAWRLENKRLKNTGLPSFSFKNEMIVFHAVQVLYLLLVYFFFGLSGLLVAIGIAVFSFLLLETINYVEHYGLRRKKKSNGLYERVMPYHSWNSNHELGRIMLYELTRHSDHHYLASKKYQLLDHHDNSPQLPLGYPGSMLMSLLPPVWFWVMNPKVRDWSKS